MKRFSFLALLALSLLCSGCISINAFETLVDEPDKKLSLEPGKEIVAITSVSIATMRGASEIFFATRHEDGTSGLFWAAPVQLDALVDQPSWPAPVNTLPPSEVPLLFVKNEKRFADHDERWWRNLEVSEEIDGRTRRVTRDEIAGAAFVSIHRCHHHEWRVAVCFTGERRELQGSKPTLDPRRDKLILVDGRELDRSRRSDSEQRKRTAIFFALVPFTAIADLATLPVQLVVGGTYAALHSCFA